MKKMAVNLKAQKRDLKQSVTKKLRIDGQVPAVVYGKEKDSSNISVDSMELLKTVRDEGRNAIITLNIDSEKPVEVMLHDYQIEPVRNELLHADFYIVDMKEEMDVEVSLRLEGEAQGSKDGGVLQQPNYELIVRAKPRDIPEEIVVNVTDLKIGESIMLSDLPKADNYEFVDDPDTTVATILAPDTIEDLEAEEDESQSVEPEVIGESDKEEE